MAQNAATNDVQQQGGQQDVQANDVHFQVNWGEWPPSPPHAPLVLYNFQQWLAAEGLQVQDGVLPANNLQDSPGLAWNDSISAYTSSDSSATLSDSFVLVTRNGCMDARDILYSASREPFPTLVSIIGMTFF